VGIIIGTYSSVFIASPIVLFWHDWTDDRKKSGAAIAPPKVSPAKEPVRKGSVRAVK
jgi:preprotein translocase subunit SecF